MKFFVPTKGFVTWLRTYADRRPIIDCGCGEGDLIKALYSKWHKVLGLDKFHSPTFDCNYFLPADVLQCLVVRQSPALLTVCRPDHSGWFEAMVDVAHPESEVLYVGLDKNLETDFTRYKYQQILFGKKVGKEGEKVFKVIR